MTLSPFHRSPSPPGALPRTVGTLAELVWLRSLTGVGHAYLEHARTKATLNFSDLYRSGVRWDGLLCDLGVGAGEVVGIAVSDPIDFATVFVSVIVAGRVAAPLDATAPDRELASACARVGSSLVIADRSTPSWVKGDWLVLPAGSFELARSEGETEASSDAPFSQGPVLPGVGVEPTDCGLPLPAPGTGALILSTSGSTGAPKLIRLTEGQLLHTARQIAAHHQLAAVDRGFNPLPLFHINAEVVGLLSTLVAGATLVLDDRFHRSGFWELMAERQVTWINAVPAIISRLVPLSPGEEVPRSVRFVRSASAPLAPATQARFEQATGVPVLETYGMTEAGSQITANPLTGPRKPGSVGRPVGVELRVVPDGDDHPNAGSAASGRVGRVEVRGPGVIQSYAGAGYEDRFGTGSWLDTGDLGHLDADGYLFLVGRVDDVINRGGEKIYPKEVEQVILGDPQVTGAVVVGWDHHELGRVPVAYLVAEGVIGEGDRDRAEAVVARVRERCRGSLSRAKRPVAFHVVERLPAGATGKVRRVAVGSDPAIYSLLVR